MTHGNDLSFVNDINSPRDVMFQCHVHVYIHGTDLRTFITHIVAISNSAVGRNYDVTGT